MILLHLTTDPRTLGFVLRQILFMRSKGWTVHAMSSPGAYAATLQSNAVPFCAVEMHPRISPFRDLVSIARMFKAMRELRPAIVHSHTLKAGLLGIVSATLARVPVKIFHLHGLPHLGSRGLKRQLLFWATRVACMLADRVFCVSFSVRQVLIDEKLCSRSKAVVPVSGSCDGIDAVDVFNPARFQRTAVKQMRATHGVPEPALAIVFIGRLVRHKGLIELAGAWAILRSKHPDLHLLIVGELEAQDRIPNETLEIFRQDERVHMTGLCQNMPELYAAVDLLVLPSYYEGLPTVLLEAAAMSLPAVATAIPGNVDAIVGNVTGLLVRPHHIFDLVTAIEQYINEPALRRRHGANGRERILSEFRPEPIREFTFDQYNELLKLRGLRLPTMGSDRRVPARNEPAALDLL